MKREVVGKFAATCSTSGAEIETLDTEGWYSLQDKSRCWEREDCERRISPAGKEIPQWVAVLAPAPTITNEPPRLGLVFVTRLLRGCAEMVTVAEVNGDLELEEAVLE